MTQKRKPPSGFWTLLNHMISIWFLQRFLFWLKMRVEQDRANSPAASPQTEELEKSRFWIRALLGMKRKQ